MLCGAMYLSQDFDKKKTKFFGFYMNSNCKYIKRDS